MEMTNLIANAANGFGAGDHLGVHVEWDVKDEVLCVVPEVSEKFEVVVYMFEDVHAEHEVKVRFREGGEEVFVVEGNARLNAFLTKCEALRGEFIACELAGVRKLIV